MNIDWNNEHHSDHTSVLSNSKDSKTDHDGTKAAKMNNDNDNKMKEAHH